jgi:hypothetical protein
MMSGGHRTSQYDKLSDDRALALGENNILQREKVFWHASKFHLAKPVFSVHV